MDEGKVDDASPAAAVRAAFEKLQAMRIVDDAERHGVSAEDVVRMAESAAMRNENWTPRPSFTLAEHDEAAFWCRWEHMRLEVEAQDSFVLHYPDGRSSVTLRLVERDGKRVVEYVDGGETLGMWDTLDEALDNVPLFRVGEIKIKNKEKETTVNRFYEFDDQELSDIDNWVEDHGMVWRKDADASGMVVISRLPKPGYFELHDVCALHTSAPDENDKVKVVGRLRLRGSDELVFDATDVKQALGRLDELLDEEG